MKTRQQGSALIFSLVILLIMTLIGVTSMNTSTLEEKMAANDRARKVAFQSAESALRDAETAIAARDYLGDLENSFSGVTEEAGYYDTGELDPSTLFDEDSWVAGADCVMANAPGETVDQGGCYKVEQIEFNAPVSHIEGATYNLITRITVRGVDNSGSAAVILQAYNNKDLTN